MDEKIREIEEYYKDDVTRYDAMDVANRALDDIPYLLARIKELGERQRWIDEVARPTHPDDERPWCAAYLDCRERVKELEAIIAETKRKKTDEEIMELWDTWRKYIANGGTASWPRDAFENVISWYEERIKKLVGGIEKVLQWRNFDGDGITDPLRMELYKLIEKEKP